MTKAEQNCVKLLVQWKKEFQDDPPHNVDSVDLMLTMMEELSNALTEE